MPVLLSRALTLLQEQLWEQGPCFAVPLATVNVSVGGYSSWKEAVSPAWMAVKHFGGHGAILFLFTGPGAVLLVLPQGLSCPFSAV